MTAGPFFRRHGHRRDHRRGRAPWPGPHPGPEGRAGGPHATGARTGPAAGGYESAALCLISLVSRPVQGRPIAASPARLAWLLGKRYGSGPPWRVTRRWRLGGVSPGGDRSPEGATGPAGRRCQGIRPTSSRHGSTGIFSNAIGVYRMTNTASLDSRHPAVRLQGAIRPSEVYGVPPLASQKPGPVRLKVDGYPGGRGPATAGPEQ